MCSSDLTFTELLQDLYKLKRKEITTAQLSGHLVPPKRQMKFRECFVASEADVLLAQIAIHNKIATPDKVEESLVRQESLALMGVSLEIGDILVEQKVITPQQKVALDKAKMQFALDRGDEHFIKVCTANNLLAQNEVMELQKYRKAQMKGLGGWMIANKLLDEEKREKIYASVRHGITGEIGRASCRERG